jgi:ornithine lipid hydroxylase
MQPPSRLVLVPALLGTALAAILLGVRAGLDVLLVTSGVNLACALLVIGLERVLPYVPAWNRSQGDLGADVAHALLSNTAVIALWRATLLGVLVRGSVALASAFGTSPWPASWPLAPQLVLALVLAELGEYWYHRWLHTSSLGWRLHAVHHSSGRLYWLNGLRGHPVDLLLSYVVQHAPLVLLGAPAEVLVLVTGFIGVNGVLKHSNADVQAGPLNWVLSTAELHRWHHSPDAALAQCNYGNNLILWDVVFGTRFLPASSRPPTQVGIAGMPGFPKDYLGQLLAPLRWARFSRSGAAGSASR